SHPRRRMTCMALLQIKAQASIRPQFITGKSRLPQRRAITRRPGGNRHEQGRVLNALQGNAAIFMRERVRCRTSDVTNRDFATSGGRMTDDATVRSPSSSSDYAATAFRAATI